jgi:hypothetical protein
MKRLALFILALALIIPAGMAQDKQKKEKVKKDLPTPILEVWGGMGSGTVTGNIAAAKNRLTGLFGVGFTLPLSKQNNLHFEGGYSFQGFNYKPGTYTVNDTAYNLEAADQRFNYFILAVQDKYFLDKKRTYYVNGGFYFAYLSHARFQANFDILENDQVIDHVELDDGNKDDFSGVDFGLTGGIGVRLGNKALSNFTIEARMAYGIINIAKSVGEIEDPKAHNIYGVLKLGIDIPVKQ